MSEERVEFENAKVRVLRVRVDARSKHAPARRGDRVLVWLTDARQARTGQDGRREEIQRRAGEVAWRDASQHEIENIGDAHEVIIVELK
jgi:hypothetical protein